jgi:hypothetical protein
MSNKVIHVSEPKRKVEYWKFRPEIILEIERLTQFPGTFHVKFSYGENVYMSDYTLGVIATPVKIVTKRKK